MRVGIVYRTGMATTNKAVLNYLRRIGSKGGRTTAERLTLEERKARGLHAIKARWAAVRARQRGTEAKPGLTR